MLVEKTGTVLLPKPKRRKHKGKLSTPEARREYQRRYYQLHKQKAKEYQRQYNLTHKKKNHPSTRGKLGSRPNRQTVFNAGDIMDSPPGKLEKRLSRILAAESDFTN
ncbi:hypothetical protein C4546_04790 [Candidatus Parcubacteria bacterium]|jgi:hypothetical protein|nr:MAG: hypothetical protein C4546_04790 [Candidatus Parcubacteria bacterium]